MAGCRNPAVFLFCELASAIRPAQSGATAEVPPMTMDCPSTRTMYPVAGSASPATSGTPRPAKEPALGTPMLACHVGSENTVLTPPPVAPSLTAVSFQTTSEVMLVPEPRSLVPPQASTCGLEAGKST